MQFLDKYQRLYHTVKPLRFEQIAYRIYYKFFKLRKVSPNLQASSSASFSWKGPEVAAPTFLGGNKVKFLNLSSTIGSDHDWNNPEYEKLWLYNLHYFDDLNAQDNLLRTETQLQLVKRWITENADFSGNGWEPYPLSLRLVNWVKWYRRAGIDDITIIISIAQQAAALSRQMEYHILGNHLFANAKALVFVGCFLDGDDSKRFLHTGLKVLEKEIPEQFLPDGGHFELSPMYHCILLWDLLDLINLALITKREELLTLLPHWRNVALRALSWLNVMQHPDGEVSFFNDSTFGISATPAQLFNYAESLNLQLDSPSSAGLVTLEASGYSRVSMPEHTLLFDHAAVGPDYLPGHAHADTLSLEWSVGMQRVLVNSGTSIYGVSEERLRQRQTAAHNTVEVDNADSSEVWSGFRVARRAYSKLIKANNENNKVTLVASHDGYNRLKGNVTHIRKVLAEYMAVTISDRLDGEFTNATAHWHLHPQIKVEQSSEFQIELTLCDGKRVIVKSDATLFVMPSSWHPSFGETKRSNKIVAHFRTAKVNTTFSII